MKKIGIVTLNGYFNFGNRLQNYALTRVLENFGFEVYTIWDKDIVRIIKDKVKTVVFWVPKYRRFRKFYKFSRKYTKELLLKNKKDDFDYIVVGSDQVWNPRYINEHPFLLYEPRGNEKVVGYATSFGTAKLPEEWHEQFRSRLTKYKVISVREDTGKEILEEDVKLENIEIMADPTFLLSKAEWDQIKRKPKSLKEDTKYILKYFLGELSAEEQEAISSYAQANGCMIIDLADKENAMFCSDPSEFIYMVANAHMVCTDSFHASVFSFLYNRPFTVFRRKGCSDYMYSRINNLLRMFRLTNREFDGTSINEENFNHDYTEAYEILAQERKKGLEFLKRNICS